MRIAFVAPFGLRHKTTVWARTLPLARRLAALGHGVSVLIPPWDSPEDAGNKWLDEGVQVRHISPARPVPAATAALLRAATREAPDILHIIKPRAHAGLVQWLLWQRAAAGAPSPRIVLDVDDWEQAWAAINHYPPLAARFLAWQEEWGIRHAHGVTAASRWLESRVHDYTHSTPVCYLPNGVTIPPASASPSDERFGAESPPTVLWFTRFVEVTPQWISDFAGALFAARPHARLVVAGHPLQNEGVQPFRSALTTRSHTGSGEVVWLGAVPHDSLPGLYAATTCAIFPATPEPLQEAKCSVRLATTLLHGVPVVASAVGEQSNYGAQGAARLLPPTASPAAFAAAVIGLLGDATARRNMVQRAQAHLAASYQWAQLGDRLEAFYEEILGNPTSSRKQG